MDRAIPKFKMSAGTEAAMSAVEELLSDELVDLHSQWERQPEEWRDSDEGNAVLAWMQALDGIQFDLGDVGAEPDVD